MAPENGHDFETQRILRTRVLSVWRGAIGSIALPLRQFFMSPSVKTESEAVVGFGHSCGRAREKKPSRQHFCSVVQSLRRRRRRTGILLRSQRFKLFNFEPVAAVLRKKNRPKKRHVNDYFFNKIHLHRIHPDHSHRVRDAADLDVQSSCLLRLR